MDCELTAERTLKGLLKNSMVPCPVTREVERVNFPNILNSRHFIPMPAHPHRATGKAQPAFWLSPQHGVDARGAQNAQ